MERDIEDIIVELWKKSLPTKNKPLQRLSFELSEKILKEFSKLNPLFSTTAHYTQMSTNIVAQPVVSTEVPLSYHIKLKDLHEVKPIGNELRRNYKK